MSVVKRKLTISHEVIKIIISNNSVEILEVKAYYNPDYIYENDGEFQLYDEIPCNIL